MAFYNTKFNFNKYDVIVLLIGLYSFTTLTQSLYPVSANRIVVACIAVLMLVSKSKKKSDLLLFLYLALALFSSIILAQNFRSNLSDFIYFAVAIIQLSCFSGLGNWENFYNAYKKLYFLLNKIVFIDLIVIIAAFFCPTSYVQHWGEGVYLYGFTESAHAMASSCCLSMSMMMLTLIERKFSLFYFALFGFYGIVVLKTGARVFIIPVAILLYYYIQQKIANKKIQLGVYIMTAAAFIIFFINSSMMQKFIYAFNDPYNNYSILASLTSRRSAFWLIDLKDFIASGITKMFIGHGFDYIYALNLKMIGMEIWAHNDFINILIAAGLLGLFIYIFYLLKVMRVAFKWNSRINKILILIYVMFPALMNGFYPYYHYFSSFFFFMLTMYVHYKERLWKTN